MVQFFQNPNINFIGFRRKAFLLSGVILIPGILSLILRGPNYGIDFTGGTLIQIHLENPVSTDELRRSLSEVGLEKAMIQRYGSATDYLIRTPAVLERKNPLGETPSGEDPSQEPQEGGSAGEAVLKVLSEDFPGNLIRIDREEMVGPRISKALLGKAIWILLLGMGVMLVYISFRFTFRFGIGAVVALFHDVLVVAGLLSLFNKELTIQIIAALLTIVGYSINDSIVVSDRIRENLKLLRKESFPRIVNDSINQTLSRTVITGLTTIMVLIVLLFFGGEVIHDFALALLIGIVVGTYSSIFVVAPIVVEWERISPTKTKMMR